MALRSRSTSRYKVDGSYGAERYVAVQTENLPGTEHAYTTVELGT